MRKWHFLVFVALAMALLGACQSAPPSQDWTISPLRVPPAPEPPVVRVALPTTLPDMLVILRTRIYFTGSGYQPKEMVVVEMDVPPGLEIPAVKPGDPVGVAFGYADEKGEFTADVTPPTKIMTFLRGDISPTLAPDPKSFKPIPHGVYTFRVTGVESGRTALSKIEFHPPGK
ncbi:MAG: hypothetical protein HXY45_07220 [Syntrophaceae bacterium]|nr:hypothetical protein [Syntrophaceae bacterium]